MIPREKRVLSCRLLIAGLLTSVLMLCPMTTLAGDQAEKAITAVKQLVAAGKVDQDAVIKLVVKQGNINNFWGKDFALKTEWEHATGIRVDASTRPQQPVLDFMRENTDFDITVARQREYPDLVSGRLIADLTPLLHKYGFALDDNLLDGYFLAEAQSEFDDQIVAIPADGDIGIMYLRKDLLDDRLKQAKYRELHRRALAVPRTWDEYQRQVEFFHDPASGIQGSCEEREPHTGWMFWMPRYVSQASPNRLLFDERMQPLIDSPEGIAATKSYLATIPFSPPEILREGNNYSYTMPLFKRGDCFSNIITMAGAKVYNLDNSAVKGKFISIPMPGTRVENRLISRPSFIYGNNLVVARASSQQELAFLYAMWLTDPDISKRAVQVVSGFADPFRYNHLRGRQMQSIYTKQALDNLAQQIPTAVPAGTGLPGDAEYIGALNRNLWLAGQGRMTAAEAMKRTAADWQRVTKKFGREEQIRHWRLFREKFPGKS